jgi:hypothetical protein
MAGAGFTVFYGYWKPVCLLLIITAILAIYSPG